MSVRRWLAEAFRDLNDACSLPHDYDLPDEPSAVAHLPAHPADTSPLQVVPECADGSAAPVEEAGAADHPLDWDAVREGLANLSAVLTDALAWIDEIDPTPGGLAQAAEHARQQQHGPRR